MGHVSSIPYIESAKKYQNVETVTILCRICVYKISKKRFFEKISPWHFFVENVFFAFLLRYDDPNQLLYLGYDYVRSNVVIYTDNLTLNKSMLYNNSTFHNTCNNNKIIINFSWQPCMTYV